MYIKQGALFYDNIFFLVDEIGYSPQCAPSILITFINMVLFKSSNFSADCKTPYMYAGQKGIQLILVVCALLCIPWMLFAKPYFLMRRQRKMKMSMSHQQMNQATENGDAEQPMHNNTAQGGHGGGGHGHEEEEDMTEIFIHQGIHTIEYVLGSVSHTASYLRLWALSLAHSRKHC